MLWLLLSVSSITMMREIVKSVGECVATKAVRFSDQVTWYKYNN